MSLYFFYIIALIIFSILVIFYIRISTRIRNNPEKEEDSVVDVDFEIKVGNFTLLE